MLSRRCRNARKSIEASLRRRGGHPEVVREGQDAGPRADLLPRGREARASVERRVAADAGDRDAAVAVLYSRRSNLAVYYR